MTALPSVHALWIGGALGPIAGACLRSFQRAGHEVVLHVYERPSDVPAGVRCSDAGLIVPRDKIIRCRSKGNYALFSDIFRYRLLSTIDCVYVDCDVLCLRPLSAEAYLFGYEDGHLMNGAVLRLPPDSAMLAALCRWADNPAPIPPWLSKGRLRRLRFQRLFGWRTAVQDLPWGVLGPRAITHVAREMGLDAVAKPIDVFYPVHHSQVPLLLDPGLSVEDLVTPRSLCLHLFNEVLGRFDLSNIPPSSPLGRILAS